MSLAGGLIAFVGKQAARRFDEATRDPLRTQTELLLGSLRRNAGTEYGRRYQLLLDQQHCRLSASGADHYLWRYPAGYGACHRGRQERLHGRGSGDVRPDQWNNRQAQVRSGHADRPGTRARGPDAHLALPRPEGAPRHPGPQGCDDGFTGHRRSYRVGPAFRIHVRTYLQAHAGAGAARLLDPLRRIRDPGLPGQVLHHHAHCAGARCPFPRHRESVLDPATAGQSQRSQRGADPRHP